MVWIVSRDVGGKAGERALSGVKGRKCSLKEGGINSVKCHFEVKEGEDKKLTIGFSNMDALGDLGKNSLEGKTELKGKARET